MTDSRLLFSPLTLDECNARAQEATADCGYRARTVLRAGGGFQPRDLAYLERRAAVAEEYHQGAMQRLPERYSHYRS